MKEKKNYWFMRNTNRSVDYKSMHYRSGNLFDQGNKTNSFAKDYEHNLTGMQKKVQIIQNASKKLMKIEEFYQLMCSGQYGKMGIRCYDHNNQLIFYCVNDHRLLCANCMYSIKQSQLKPQTQSLASKRTLTQSGKKTNTNSQNKHKNHDVKQISKSIKQLSNDLNNWQNQYKSEVSLMNDCKIQWEKLKQKFEESKNLHLTQLDKQYDQIQMKLSKQYAQAKKQLTKISQICVQCLQKIINTYKSISKLIIPNRYPVPAAKHSWLYLMKNRIFDMVPMRVQRVPTQWLKIYNNHSKLIITKFVKGRVQQNEPS